MNEKQNKICSKCNVSQELSEFGKNKATKDFLNTICKTCIYKSRVWSNMVQRCYNINNPSYKNYGGKGITICSQWQTYSGMREWIDQRWIKGLEMGRIDNNKGYSPDNCRFVTRTTNQLNKLNYKGRSSQYRGVSWFKHANKWHSQIVINGKKKHIGLFVDELEAAKSYDKYVIDNNLSNKLNFIK